MMNRPSFLPTSRRSNRGGFTLVELLVVIAIIGLLAAVAYPNITNALNNAKHNVAMQNAKSIGGAMFQYALDPNNTSQSYPYGTTSTVAFETLLNQKYLSSASILYLPGPGKATFAGADATNGLAAANVSWDIMATPAGNGGQATGLTTNASDDTPLVFSTGNAVNLAAQGATVVTMNAATNPFKTDGMAVCYKGTNASFIKATGTGNNYTLSITPASYNDTAYIQVMP